MADTDSDGDGLADCADNCLTVANASQDDDDRDGLGNACDDDDDNDNIDDADDQCPGTVDAVVDANGCPLTGTFSDSDNDGVANQYVANPARTQMPSAVTVRIYLLMRSAEPDAHYVNTKTYNL